MISINRRNVTTAFCGIKFPNKIPPVLKASGLQTDVFCKNQSVPKCVIEDGISKETFDKVKDIVIPYLKAKRPKEKLVCINNDKITYKMTGDNKSCKISKKAANMLKKFDADAVIIHGHPANDGTASPVSLDDYMQLVKYPGLKSIYALNAQGEYSVLRKPDNYNIFFMSGGCQELYWDELYEYFEKLGTQNSKKYVELNERFGDLCRTSKEAKCIRKQIYECVSALQEEGNYLTKFVHNFWLRNADELGVKYETNFSKLQ